jgi:hypothetical protein
MLDSHRIPIEEVLRPIKPVEIWLHCRPSASLSKSAPASGAGKVSFNSFAAPSILPTKTLPMVAPRVIDDKVDHCWEVRTPPRAVKTPSRRDHRAADAPPADAMHRTLFAQEIDQRRQLAHRMPARSVKPFRTVLRNSLLSSFAKVIYIYQ